jgi:catechol 2,3-dioxygenase-like lactoylglutathione lyase family enzyme
MKLEVVVFSVSDVNRAKAFYENLGWRLDLDIAEGGYHNVHMTPVKMALARLGSGQPFSC